MTSTTADGSTFVDTNILVYAHDASDASDASDAARQRVAAQLLDDRWQFRDGVLSTQVLTEFYAVVTRKFDPPLSRCEAKPSSTHTRHGPSCRWARR
jgi:predicted nucleic acid-binding protein